jgi:predicted PP-loop superfamily ATPase
LKNYRKRRNSLIKLKQVYNKKEVYEKLRELRLDKIFGDNKFKMSEIDERLSNID